MKNIKVVAITGRSGSGKTTVSKYLAARGFVVLDADKFVAETLLNNINCKEKLVECFGADILYDNKIDKKLLAKAAFSSKENQQKLTDITHPFITGDILKEIDKFEAKGEKLVFVDGAVIIGNSFEQHCDKFIIVLAAEEDIYIRLTKRDSIDDTAIKKRLMYQNTPKQLIERADYIIENTSDTANIYRMTDIVLAKLQEDLL